MKRDRHNLSHYRLLTHQMGRLYPVAHYEVLPGDTVQQSSSVLMRCSPLLAPVMHPCSVRVHHWFVPYRILWDGWEKFITGGKDGAGDGVGLPPTLSSAGVIVKGSLADHLGLPPGLNTQTTPVLAWPFAAFKLILKEWYFDQDFWDEAQIPPDVLQWGVPSCAWEKDYFTTARPWPQKGPDVNLPLQGSAAISAVPNQGPTFRHTDNLVTGLTGQAGSGNVGWSAMAGVTNPVKWDNPNLQVDLTQATAANVNDVRLAFALQRYQEARARYGSRYTEYLRYLGVKSSDARLQRPEFLGGGKATVSFSEVLQTGPDADDAGVATLKGHGIAAVRSNKYRRFFEEHGIVMSILSVRPKTIYAEALHKSHLRSTKEDYWQRELEQIGQQEVDNREIYGKGAAGLFGYQDRYSEYKSIPSTVHGDFRDTLNHWHLARSFAAQPVCNGAFMECDPSPRIFASQTGDTMWTMVYNSIQARRLVRRSGASRII